MSEFPKLLKKPDGGRLVVENLIEQEQALEAGWFTSPGLRAHLAAAVEPLSALVAPGDEITLPDGEAVIVEAVSDAEIVGYTAPVPSLPIRRGRPRKPVSDE